MESTHLRVDEGWLTRREVGITRGEKDVLHIGVIQGYIGGLDYIGCIGSVYEVQAICPTYFNGHGFLIRDYIRDYTTLHTRRWGPLCPLKTFPQKANIDSSSNKHMQHISVREALLFR